MKKKTKDFLMNPWTIAIGSGLLLLIVTIVIDVVSALTILSTIKKNFAVILNGILSFLNFRLKVWWILLGVVFIVFVLHLISEYCDYKQKATSEPKFVEYTKDYILGFYWKWTWDRRYDGKYDIVNLHPVCSKCDTPLTNSDISYGKLKCLRCNEEYWQHLPSEQNIKLMITDNVRRKYFPNE